MPNRIIKETIRTSKDVNNLSDFDFRVWCYLITYVDDYGRGSADTELLKGLCFPRRKNVTEKQIAQAIADLAGCGMVILYEVGGEPFLAFPSWDRHQQIRSKKSKFPAPEDGVLASDIICNQLISDDGKCPRNPIQSESNPNPNPNARGDSTRSQKHKYGTYGNVLLTDEEMAKLKAEIPDWKKRIDRLSEYMESTGKTYKNHYATIRSWAAKDGATASGASGRKMDGDEEAAIRAMMQA